MKALTKTSSNEEIKAYFKAVFELSRSEEDFPVDAASGKSRLNI